MINNDGVTNPSGKEKLLHPPEWQYNIPPSDFLDTIQFPPAPPKLHTEAMAAIGLRWGYSFIVGWAANRCSVDR